MKNIIILILISITLFAKPIERLELNSTEYNTLKSEILSIQVKNYDTKKAKEVTNAILIYATDFTRKRYQIKYAKEIANLDTKKQSQILKRYKQTIIHINPNKIPYEKQSKAMRKSLQYNIKYIIKFYDALGSTPYSESIAIKHEKKVPELKDTDVIKIEKQEGQIADIKAKIENARIDLILKGFNREIEQLDYQE